MKVLLISIILLFTVTGCCWTDHSEVIKEVAEPMLEQLDAFYKKNKRHPNKKERDEMLLASGCSKVKNEQCSYGWKTIVITKAYVDDTEYRMTLNYDNTYCSFGVYDGGDLANMYCANRPCIYISH